jgi:hypothetical protein
MKRNNKCLLSLALLHLMEERGTCFALSGSLWFHSDSAATKAAVLSLASIPNGGEGGRGGALNLQHIRRPKGQPSLTIV